jgi:hypothetical protein
MNAVLKWTTAIWLAVLAGCAACYLMFIHQALLPVAWVVGSMLIPIVLAPLFVVVVLTPGTAPEWVFITNAAIALYVWLLALVCLGFIVKAWQEERTRLAGSL